MSLLLAIHGYPGTQKAAQRHLPYYLNAGADKILGVSTTDGNCGWPEPIEEVKISHSSYIDGPVLPKRLLDTMRLMLLLPYDRYCIIEWDCLFFKPLPEFTGMAAFHAGNRMGDMRTERFFHCPWAFDFDTGTKFMEKGYELLPQVSGHEASPDVFFGWVCEQAGIEVAQPWNGFSRNSLDCVGDVELAQAAYRIGAMAIHGIKTEANLATILA